MVNPRHPVKIRLRTGVDRDGRMVAHQAHLIFNGGAYAAAKPMPNAIVPAGPTMEVYSIPNVRMETTVVYTNTPCVSPYRGAGRPHACFVMERLIDRIARELELEPNEVRRRNFQRMADIVNEEVPIIVVMEFVQGFGVHKYITFRPGPSLVFDFRAGNLSLGS